MASVLPPPSAPSTDALRDRVRLIGPDIVLWHEVDHPTEQSVDRMGQALRDLEETLGEYAVLANLTGASRPSAAVRARLRVAFRRERVFHFAVFTERNMMLNAAAYFVLSGLGLRSHSVHRLREEALRAIDRAR